MAYDKLDITINVIVSFMLFGPQKPRMIVEIEQHIVAKKSILLWVALASAYAPIKGDAIIISR
tara:strand:+ start:32 stop:220 length:189 start_codon:yes stop_codon:yes gene_type:complete